VLGDMALGDMALGDLALGDLALRERPGVSKDGIRKASRWEGLALGPCGLARISRQACKRAHLTPGPCDAIFESCLRLPVFSDPGQ
jgi:hypothetical protein